MANRWGNNGNSDRLYFGGLQITADGDCSHEIKTHLLLGREVMANLDSILKSRDIILLRKVHFVKAIVFPVVMHGCETWTIKKAEHQRTDFFFYFILFLNYITVLVLPKIKMNPPQVYMCSPS